MVRTTTLTEAPFGVTAGGAKLQLVSAGRVEQVKVSVRLKPLSGVTVICTVAGWTGVRTTLSGAASSLKSVIVTLVLEVLAW